MTAEIVIFNPLVHPATEVSDLYLKVIKGGNQHTNEVLGYEVPIRASIYHELAPIAARQGLSVSVFVSRLCEAVIEMEPAKGEVSVS